MLRFAVSIAVLSALASVSIAAAAQADSAQGARIVNSFDEDWRFLKADAPGAEVPGFDDTAWRTLGVPHDWSIEGPFDAKNTTGGAGGFLPAGVGWYRKHFTLPTELSGRRVFIEFDGVMANSDVWINGQHLGRRPYGYVSFHYEMTGKLNFGADKTNVLAVRADNSAQPASRWSSGAGIYRHVRLIAADPVHIGRWGTFITAPEVKAEEAAVRVQTTVLNQSADPRDASLRIKIIAPDGKTVQTADTEPQTIAAGKSADFKQDLTVKNPQLWNLDRPALYRAELAVRSGDAVIDNETVTFGVRDFKFEPATGFWLNGKNFKIKGVCLHHDAGAMGAAVPLGIWERRLASLKELGVNGIRTAHNPPAPEFLDLCDRMGLLVMDEFFDCWTVGKNPYDYHLYFADWSKIDAADTIRRDRNHPSIVLYSVGNEIHDTPKAELAKGILKGLVEVCHENDPTRPATQALFRPNVSHDYDNGLADMLDVIGTNYRDTELLAAYNAKPTRKIIGTEQGHDRKIWLILRNNPPEAGQFLWTGIDYLGESRGWPIVAAGSGLLDLTGRPKPMAFERQSWWSEKPMVRIARRVTPPRTTAADPGFEPLNRRQSQFCDWTPQNADPHQETVEVYSNCDEVELVLNDKSLGSKSRDADDAPRTWKVDFQPGTIKALGKNKDQLVATDELRTAAKPAKILLTADCNGVSPGWDNICCVTAAVTDESGVVCPEADDPINFKISGPGVIAAVGSADRTSHEPFQAAQRHAYQGRCMAIVKATRGDGRQITVTASAPDLGESTVTIENSASPAAGQQKTVSGKTASTPPSQPPIDPKLPTLFLVGDSTIKNSTDKGDGGLWGWGHFIGEFFDKSRINVQNRALGGRSSRSYQTEGLWDKVLSDMKPGDFVMVQLGTNDGGSLNQGRARASLKGNGEETQEVELQATGKKEVVHSYGWYMRKYAADAKAKGATPIILSIVPRNMWTDGKVNRASKDYGKWAAEAANDGGALFIDLNEIVAKHYESDGQDKVKAEYFTAADHTHTTEAGAKLTAKCVIEGLKELKDCALLNYLSPEAVHSKADEK
jgi:beta-galactosidase